EGRAGVGFFRKEMENLQKQPQKNHPLSLKLNPKQWHAKKSPKSFVCKSYGKSKKPLTKFIRKWLISEPPVGIEPTTY
ncbi:MAG: hypothetical protein WD555_02825, partial [Fulvivirga sp.]